MPTGGAPEIGGLTVGWGAIFSFITTLLGSGALVAWIKTRNESKKLDQDGDTRLRSEMWTDIANLKLAKEDQSRRITLAETKIASQTVQIGQLRFISSLLIDELERLDPRNSIARQARFMLDTVQPDAMPNAEEVAPMAEIMAKLSRTEGECE